MVRLEGKMHSDFRCVLESSRCLIVIFDGTTMQGRTRDSITGDEAGLQSTPVRDAVYM